MNTTERATITAPAKINLGLEILGKRADGYHEILTIMAAIDLADTLEISVGSPDEPTRISGIEGVDPGDNLILKAIDVFATHTGITNGYDAVVEKRIPSPGGLGGASSDAAATLLALNDIHGRPLKENELASLAAGLGSDVPFFLGTPLALVSGTGTALQALPPISAHAVLVVPTLYMQAKTARLYGALTPSDMTDGDRVRQLAEAIRPGQRPNGQLLWNAFTRPLYEMQPSLRDLARLMSNAGAPHVALSGAGPAHYALFDSSEDASRFASAMKRSAPERTAVYTVSLLTKWRRDPDAGP